MNIIAMWKSELSKEIKSRLELLHYRGMSEPLTVADIIVLYTILLQLIGNIHVDGERYDEPKR